MPFTSRCSDGIDARKPGSSSSSDATISAADARRHPLRGGREIACDPAYLGATAARRDDHAVWGCRQQSAARAGRGRRDILIVDALNPEHGGKRLNLHGIEVTSAPCPIRDETATNVGAGPRSDSTWLAASRHDSMWTRILI